MSASASEMRWNRVRVKMMRWNRVKMTMCENTHGHDAVTVK